MINKGDELIIRIWGISLVVIGRIAWYLGEVIAWVKGEGRRMKRNGGNLLSWLIIIGLIVVLVIYLIGWMR
jgi:hypothetical protein